MKPLNRPMFRMGGPIKEGIMDGIEEPRQGFKEGTPPTFFGLRFKEPINFSNLFKSPATVEKEKRKELASIFAPDYSMSDYGKVPIIRNELIASKSDMVPNQKIELVDENTISTSDIDPFANLKVPGAESKMSSTEAQDFAFDTSTGGGSEPKSTYITKMEEGMLKRGTPGGDAGVIIPPKKPREVDTRESIDNKKLREILGYDRAVKRGNYSLIEAIRKGLTEGGVQGALDAAFAAGDTAYKDAEKLRQVADLKQYERELELKDYDKKRKDAIEDYEAKLKLKKQLDPDKQAKGIIQKNYEFLTGVLGMEPDKARRISTKETEATIDAQILAVQKSSGLPKLTTDVLDGAGGVFYGNEYKGRISGSTDTGELADGWYLVDGNTFVEIEAGTIKGKSRTYSPAG